MSPSSLGSQLLIMALRCTAAASGAVAAGGKDRKPSTLNAGTPAGPVSVQDLKANFGRFQKAGKGVMSGLAFAASAATGAEGDTASSGVLRF